MAMVIVLKAMEPSWMRLGRETLGKELPQVSNWCLAVPLKQTARLGLLPRVKPYWGMTTAGPGTTFNASLE